MGLTFYEGPQDADIRKTVRLRLYTDDGENQHVDGAVHWGVLAFLGEEGDCPGSGAVFGHSQKASGVIGESVPVNELMGAAMGIKITMLLKYLLEELSGATRGDWDTTDMNVERSAAPMTCTVSSAVDTAVTQPEGEDGGQMVVEKAMRLLGRQGGDNRPAIDVLNDNAGVVGNVNHVSRKSKGLRRVVRMVAFMQSLVHNNVISVSKVSRADQRADGGDDGIQRM